MLRRQWSNRPGNRNPRSNPPVTASIRRFPESHPLRSCTRSKWMRFWKTANTRCHRRIRTRVSVSRSITPLPPQHRQKLVDVEKSEVSSRNNAGFGLLSPVFGLPFRNERVVERQPVAFEHEHPNALALLDRTAQNPISLGSRHRYQRQRNLTAMHLDGMEFQTHGEVTRGLVLLLEANDPPVRDGAFRSQDAPMCPDRIQQLSFDGVAGKRELRVDC